MITDHDPIVLWARDPKTVTRPDTEAAFFVWSAGKRKPGFYTVAVNASGTRVTENTIQPVEAAKRLGVPETLAQEMLEQANA